MNFLYQALSERVEQWRSAGYVNERYPAIAEILHYASTEDELAQLRYLRRIDERQAVNYSNLKN